MFSCREFLPVTKLALDFDRWVTFNDQIRSRGIFELLTVGEKHSEIGSRCHYTMPGVNSVNPVEMLRILRICYMYPPSAVIVDSSPAATDAEPAQPTANGEPGGSGSRRSAMPLTYETFTPELVRDLELLTESPPPDADPPPVPTRVVERMEMMKETFSKVIAFLRNTGEYYSHAVSLTVVRDAQLSHTKRAMLPYVMQNFTVCFRPKSGWGAGTWFRLGLCVILTEISLQHIKLAFET